MEPVKTKSIDFIKYSCSIYQNKKVDTVSISVIGLDTEAYDDGKCFMIASSEGDCWHPEEFPRCLFNRKYRQKNFVTYNLKYDSGAFVQKLPYENLNQLRTTGETLYDDFKYKVIANKCFTITRKKSSIHIYDIMGFYGGSLDYNAKKYLNNKKDDIDTKTFTRYYVVHFYQQIYEYCVQDAKLTKDLANLIINKFEQFGVYPQKLYSTAYVTYQYFKSHCKYPRVNNLWKNNRMVLDYAMRSYNGGKFEITVKGTSELYEYDIVSAYPYEIRNLIDISNCRIVYDSKYRKTAVYGFVYCKIVIPVELPSPIAIQRKGVNIYPTGYIEKVITKKEYEYFVNNNVDISIIQGVWLHSDKKTYPFRKEIDKLIQHKKSLDKNKQALDYKTIKIFLNSLYGKFVQLIDRGDYYAASSCWNPIYGSIITANTRLRITEMQRLYPEIIAVHTDSIISTKPLPIKTGKELGDYDFCTSGQGVILGCGVYQIGDITKIRGFRYKGDLLSMIDNPNPYIEIDITKVYSWREVCFHNWPKKQINKFEGVKKKLRVDSDKKRLWMNDYKSFSEVLKRKVVSLPYYYTKSGI